MPTETIRRQGERVERFRPRETRYALSDSVVAGLQLRVSPDGSKMWSLRLKTKAGIARRVTLGEAGNEAPKLTVAEARKKAEDIRSQVRGGADPQAELFKAREVARRQKSEEEHGTVSALGGACLAALKLRPSTRAGWERLFRKEIEPVFGRRLAKGVTRGDVREWGRKIVRRGSPITANRSHSVLARIFSWGVAEEIISASPFLALPKPALDAEVSRDRVLSESELSAILKALDALEILSDYERKAVSSVSPPHGDRSVYVAACELLFLTGVRRQNVVRAHRSEFQNLDDPKRAQWTIPASGMKAGRAHVVPLAPATVEIVKARLAKVKGEYLFPVNRGRNGREGGDRPMTWNGHFVKLWKEVADVLHGSRIEDWRIHDARRAVATHLRERFKVGGDVVRALLAHSAAKGVTGVYDRSEFLEERREALNEWAAWLSTLRTGRPQGGKVVPFKKAAAR